MPVTMQMINAANGIYTQLKDWQKADQLLASLELVFPGFSLDEIIVKVTVVNSFYATRKQPYDILRISEHFHNIIHQQNDPHNPDMEMLNKMMQIPNIQGRQISLVSKFVNCFMNDSQFPIWDEYAKRATRLFLKKQPVKQPLGRIADFHTYEDFCDAIDKLKHDNNINPSNRCLDRFLWLAGQYNEFHTVDKPELGKEVNSFFEDRSNEEILNEAFGRN
jgi:hypothetical protein